MKTLMLAGAVIVAVAAGPVFSGPAFAAPGTCANAGQLSRADLVTLLQTNCACSDSGNPQQWNETHQGAGFTGSIWERGNTVGALSAANSIGSYQITQNNLAIGLVVYTYGATPYTYSIATTTGTAPGLVRFCQRNNGAPNALNGTSYDVKIKAGACPPFPC